MCSHFLHLYSIDRARHLSHLRSCSPHFGHGNFTLLDVSLLQLVHFIDKRDEKLFIRFFISFVRE